VYMYIHVHTHTHTQTHYMYVYTYVYTCTYHMHLYVCVYHEVDAIVLTSTMQPLTYDEIALKISFSAPVPVANPNCQICKKMVISVSMPAVANRL
jgi:hypothetical protein